jgi:hypothetical protein
MLEPIIYIDRSDVREGKLTELRSAIEELAAFVESNEPRIIAYRMYLNQVGRQMTILHIHPDSASLEFHMKIAGPAFAKFKDLIRLSGIDIYGTPSEQLRKQLTEKARLLGSGTVNVYEFRAGFARLGLG